MPQRRLLALWKLILDQGSKANQQVMAQARPLAKGSIDDVPWSLLVEVQGLRIQCQTTPNGLEGSVSKLYRLLSLLDVL